MQRHSITLFIGCFFLFGCSPEVPAINSLTGSTMGTTYNITYPSEAGIKDQLKISVDSLLERINLSLSTYIDSSLISRINSASPNDSIALDPHFITVYSKALEVYNATDGAFNPAVGPIVSAWGFGAQPAQDLSHSDVDSLLELIRLDAFSLNASLKSLTKTMAGAQLDFSAIAKGYGVDAVANLLDTNGIDSYFIEIGGEVRTSGIHPSGERHWAVGIDMPAPQGLEDRKVQTVIEIQDRSLATSGNYRNFYIKDGKKYVHTINPFTGYPEESDLLSASVLAADCMTADAYATAFMVLGERKSLALVDQLDDIEAYFITSDSLGNYRQSVSNGFPLPLPLNEQ